MGEDQRTPEAELGLFRQFVDELRDLAEACRPHLSQLELRRAPGSPAEIVLRTWPPQAIHELLGERDSRWPATVLMLFDAAERQKHELGSYLRRFEEALEALLAEGQSGRLRFYGSRHTNKRAVQIPPISLVTQLRLDGERRHLTRDPITALRRGAGQASEDAKITYYDTRVDASDLAKILVRQPANELQNASDSKSVARMEAWYINEHIPYYEKLGRPASHQEDQHAAALKFPNVPKRREHIRYFRKEHAPELWRGPGRRPKRK